MRIKTLFLSLCLILLIACNQRNNRPVPDFYKNLITNEILTKTEFESLINKLHQDIPDSMKGNENITMHFVTLIISNDSIIQPFDYDIRIGDEYIVRAGSYDKIGMKIAPQQLLTIDGDSIQIGGRQSKPTLINLWFVECPGCVAEIPALNKLQEKYADSVNFIALTFEDKKVIKRFLKRKEFNFIHVSDANFINFIGTKPYPENIFINKEGDIQYIEGVLSNDENLDLVIKHFELIIEKLLLPDSNLVNDED